MTTAAVVPEPRFYVASWAARTGQRISARVIDTGISMLVVGFVLLIGPHGRPFAQDLLILGLVTAIETTSIATRGATIGMGVIGLEVRAIDRVGNPSWLQAYRRTLPVAMCSMVLLPGTFVMLIMPIVLLVSISLSPLRQAFHDRLSNTLVVTDGAPDRVTPEMLELWWDPSRGVTMTPWGRVPDLHDRRRARAHRLDRSWWLSAVIVAATVLTAMHPHSGMLLLWLALGWIALLVFDETVSLSRTGTTPGHASMGYRVVDLTTGEPPSVGRALARSLVLAPLLYLPPLQLLLALWVQASSMNRGPHDLAGHTVVVEPDYVPPRLNLPPRPAWNAWAIPQVPHHHRPGWVPPPPPPPPPPLQPPAPPEGQPPLGAF